MRWTVKLVAEVEPGQSIEHEIMSVDRGDRITPATLGLTLAEGKVVLAAIQAQLVVDQVARHGAVARECLTCGRVQASKGHYQSTFRSVFGNVPMRVRRFHACRCRPDGPQTVPALFTRQSPIAPELRFLTAKLAALMPFRTVAAFLTEVLPLSSKAHASTVRNRTVRVGKRLLRSPEIDARPPTSDGAVVIGLDGGYVRNRHPRPARTFEVVAGQIRGAGAKVTRFAFVRTGRAAGAAMIRRALRAHGVAEHTRLTVLSDGDAGLRAIQRAAVPDAEPVLDWFHIAMRWQHLHQLARGVVMQHGENTATRAELLMRLERAKWALWHGQLGKTRRRLSELRDWTWDAPVAQSWLQHFHTHLHEMTAYLNANADSLPNYGARYRVGAPISTAFAESAVNAIVSKRMIKRQQMRWNRDTVQPFLTVRVAVLNDTLEHAFRSWHAGFRPLEAPDAPCAA